MQPACPKVEAVEMLNPRGNPTYGPVRLACLAGLGLGRQGNPNPEPQPASKSQQSGGISPPPPPAACKRGRSRQTPNQAGSEGRAVVQGPEWLDRAAGWVKTCDIVMGLTG